ncbi:MAG: ATP-dependent DNA helicase RecG [Pseudomonadota bacterium]|nr:ATP-dependent DNA helicase RecG [Pseudomonadota bacterium]
MVTSTNLDDTNLESLPSVGPATKVRLNSIGINRISDLILFLPSFLIDKTSLTNLRDVEHSSTCLFVGVITKIYKSKGFKPNLIITVDVDNTKIQIRFLHKIIIYSNLKPGLKIRFSGLVRIKGRLIEMIHPEIEVLSGKKHIENVVPYYKTRKIISQNKIRKLIKYVYDYISTNNNKDVLSDKLLERLKLPHYLDALQYCHFPSSDDYDESNELFERGRQRFIIEELLAYKIILNDAKKKFELNKSAQYSILDININKFIESLPFNLTPSQLNAINDIKTSFGKTFPTKRLIQGDVGSGKTIIAAIASLYATSSKLQVAFLVPTEILADQHTKTFKNIFSNLPINISCLKSKLQTKEKKLILSSVTEGKIDILIGTHSLIEKNVVFKNLGLVIIDEQHKFGINQRIKISSNNVKGFYPHEIYLSATPIPRSLSLVLYEGLDYTTIKHMPSGRKPIITQLVRSDDKEDLYRNIQKILDSNNQIYWVCSCIDFTETLETEYVTNQFEILSSKFPDFKIGILHGRNDPKDNKINMQLFVNGEIDILVCTTMIEVGIDVPNATCIVIEDSNRFGLSQLHQLRGRVGRSDKQSYCYLIYKNVINDQAMRRLSALEKHTNGFNIAEEDLKLRGEGDYLGSKQSGSNHNFKLATPDDALENYDIVKDAMEILDDVNVEDKKKLIRRWDKPYTETIEL